MNLAALESMSSDALQAIRDKCVEILGSRKCLSLRHGAVGWFFDRQGAKRFLKVERINPKTVSGHEVDGVTHQRLTTVNWRVSPQLLNIVGEVAPVRKAPTAPVTPHRPTTSIPSSW